MAKNLLGKYVWLVETIYKAGRITFEEINQKWLDDDMDSKEIPLRTFHKWRIAAEDMFGLVIDCERKGGYHYYIGNASEIEGGESENQGFSRTSQLSALTPTPPYARGG